MLDELALEFWPPRWVIAPLPNKSPEITVNKAEVILVKKRNLLESWMFEAKAAAIGDAIMFMFMLTGGI